MRFPTVPVLTCARLRTWAVRSGLFGVEFGLEWRSGLQFGFGKLRQVGHHRLLVYTGIDDLLWSDHLHVHTMGVSLKGVVFVSKGCSARPSSHFLREQSGLIL